MKVGMRMSDDTISRQAAIDAVNTALFPKINTAKDAEKALRALPSAQPERRWIPCSKRMPKKNGFYLCTTKDCITILEFIEGNPHYHEEPSFVSDVLGKCNSYVVAWMPLPEPYAERRSDE